MKTIKLTGPNQSQVIKQTLKVLKAGGLVVFPSDTVYGLLCDATNPKAVTKLLAFKERPSGKAISVFMADKNIAEKYVTLNQNAKNIIKNLLPGPFTVVSLARLNLASSQGSTLQTIDPRLLAENGTLGFRIPDFPLINQLLIAYGLPLTATSANLSSKPPHNSISSLLASLSDRKQKMIDLIIDGGKLPKNKPSTVIDTTGGQLKTLRFGDLLPATPNSLISKSEKQTHDLARFILSKTVKKSVGKPLIFLLKGELGTGKTIFTKGLGKALGIKENIVSPTFTISYEYKIPKTFSTNFPQLSTVRPIGNGSWCDTKRLDQNNWLVEQNLKSIKYQVLSIKKIEHCLVHYDLYRIETPEDLKEIRFLESFKPGNIYSVEWPEKIDKQTISRLKKETYLVYIKINYWGKNQREISWSN